MVRNCFRVPAWLLLLAGVTCVAAEERPILLPTPKRVTWHDGSVLFAGKASAPALVSNTVPGDAVATGIRQLYAVFADAGCRAVTVYPRIEDAVGAAVDLVIWVGTADELPALNRVLKTEVTPPSDATVPDGYCLEFGTAGGKDVLICCGHDERGCFYGLQTVMQLLVRDGDALVIPRVTISDWPTYRIRLVKVSATKNDPDTVIRLGEILPRYKVNVYGLQYHSESNGTWREPSAGYRKAIEQVGASARRDGVLEPALFLCPFFKPVMRLEPGNDDLGVYLDRLRWGISKGCRWIEIDFNDWGKWDRLSPSEQERFGDSGTFMTHVTNAAYRAAREQDPDVGVIVCPSVGWYHGPAKPELVALCQTIPDDVFVYWTGPVVRSRRIARAQIEAWTGRTGRKPFLWDNTIYAHFQPYWVGYAFNPYFNRFPAELPDMLAGPGIHLNAVAMVLYLPGFLAFADYVWNPEAYRPEVSIRRALVLLWGEEGADAAERVREQLAGFYTWLYEARQLWTEFKPGVAEAMLLDLAQSIDALAGIANDEALTCEMADYFLGPARQAAANFKPVPKPRPRPTSVARSLAAGAVNPSAEEVVDGKPVGWSAYRGAGQATLAVSDQAKSGTRSLCLRATRWYHDPKHVVHGDRTWINVALVHGSERGGMAGGDAYDVAPETAYRCGFWLKGDVPTVELRIQGWSTGLQSGDRHVLEAGLSQVVPSTEWQHHELSFRTDYDTAKLAVMFVVKGYEDEGMRLGRIWVDDVSLEPVGD